MHSHPWLAIYDRLATHRALLALPGHRERDFLWPGRGAGGVDVSLGAHADQLEQDRDHNAALNILSEALRLIGWIDQAVHDIGSGEDANLAVDAG